MVKTYVLSPDLRNALLEQLIFMLKDLVLWDENLNQQIVMVTHVLDYLLSIHSNEIIHE